MTDAGGADRRGIEIPAEVAAAAGVPDDLNADAVGEFAVPDTRRRRKAGLVYLTGAAVAVTGAASGVSDGFWVLTGGFIAIAAYHAAAGVRLVVRESEALELANAATNFAVGHASAVLGFDGLLARPVWNVLVFSADEPPSQRGLVRVGALDSVIVEQYTEQIESEQSMSLEGP